ncbi:hypothetical protein OHB41_48330 [Streptomyces sp. NBC_01571]|uniref:hypothetical protein n=1 Tax=Streptomyces sp. NBC_01571 TaxID=2975883 RepID=UPI002256909D|nr:hypothetical protein [Streptomyces sp. NBC_01571]MCX4580791.1 hypothetical protein [Streptomyces sp. NBC_01571]
MGNLGAYEVFSAAAKKAGGVEALLGTIKKAAFTKGATAGAVGGGLVVGTAVIAATRAREAYKARQARAEAAEAQLKDAIQDS